MANFYFMAFVRLSEADQRIARAKFSTAGRRDGWERIERWAFPVKKDGSLMRTCPFIEPAYSLEGVRFDLLFQRPCREHEWLVGSASYV